MKRVKIMLLSLALFAVVGGALAFKAKLGLPDFCTTNAYFANNAYYCSFKIGTNPTTYAICPNLVIKSTTNPLDLVKKVCTTTTDETGVCGSTCSTLASIKID